MRSLITVLFILVPALASADPLDDAWSLCQPHYKGMSPRMGGTWDSGFEKCADVSAKIQARANAVDAQKTKLDALTKEIDK